MAERPNAPDSRYCARSISARNALSGGLVPTQVQILPPAFFCLQKKTGFERSSKQPAIQTAEGVKTPSSHRVANPAESGQVILIYLLLNVTSWWNQPPSVLLAAQNLCTVFARFTPHNFCLPKTAFSMQIFLFRPPSFMHLPAQKFRFGPHTIFGGWAYDF